MKQLMEKLFNFIKAMKIAYNQQEELKSQLGKPNLELAKKLSKQTVLSLEESVNMLKHYEFDMEKCLNITSFACSIGRNPYEYFLRIKYWEKEEPKVEVISKCLISSKELPGNPTWKQRINNLMKS